MADAQRLEKDAPRWPEPFAAMYARIKYQSYLVLLLAAGWLVFGVMLYRLGAHAAAHVYEVRLDGSAAYIGDREANITPRASEARFVAKRFVELLYGWNSSTVLEDVTEVVNMCSKAMGEQLSRELATAQFVENLRKRNVRTEIEWKSIDVVDQSPREFKVHVVGRADIFPLSTYEGAPIDTREFSMLLVLGVVPRDPERRLNGLEVIRIERAP